MYWQDSAYYKLELLEHNYVITVNEIINDKFIYLTYLEIRYFKKHTMLFSS